VQALESRIFPDLQNHAFLSISVFCDAGCTVQFTETSVQVKHDNQVILEGIRELPGLWKIQKAFTNATFTTLFKQKALTFLHASMLAQQCSYGKSEQ
jgi:hypothetical protein